MSLLADNVLVIEALEDLLGHGLCGRGVLLHDGEYVMGL
jgi:hypothetical protein